MKQVQFFQPVPLDQMPPPVRQSFDLARQMREDFLADTSFPFFTLIGRVADATKVITTPNVDPAAIQTALAKVAEIRPLGKVPILNLVIWLAVMQRQAGNAKAHATLTGFMYSIGQVMAHSGDGLSKESAVHDVSYQEEHEWLRLHGLTWTKHQTIQEPGATYSVFETRDESGDQGLIYFNSTRRFARQTMEFADLAKKNEAEKKASSSAGGFSLRNLFKSKPQ